MAKSPLSMPMLSSAVDPSVRSAFTAITNWARTVEANYVALDDLKVGSKTAETLTQSVVRRMAQGGSGAGATAGAVDATNATKTAQIARAVLENSGTEKPIQLNAPVTFVAGGSSTNVYIGAGGLFGQNAGNKTFGISSADGGFFFGNETTPAKQITFDPTAGELTFGSSIRVKKADASYISLETMANATGYSDTDVQDYLNAGVTNILAGSGGNYRMQVDTTSAKVVMYHKDAVYAGYSAVADSTNTRLPAIGLTSAGIAMGFNDIDGNWKNAVAITADGSFAFGHTAGKQILWDGTAGELVLGSSVRVTSTGGTTMSTIESNASYGPAAYSGLSNKLNKSAADIISGVLDVDTSTYNGGIRTGSVTWNTTTGAITGGSGVVITKKGLIGVASGVTKFSIDGSTGAATFAGDISGASGTFAGSISSSGYVYATGAYGSYGVTVNYDGTSRTSYGTVVGVNASGSDTRTGVIGVGSGGSFPVGVLGYSATAGGIGVVGHSDASWGVFGVSNTGVGVYGLTFSTTKSSFYAGVKAVASGGAYALYCSGPAHITGDLTINNTTLVSNLNADLHDGYHAGNSSGYVPVSNGTVNTNLNADLLDGYHASSFSQSSHTHSTLIQTSGGAHTYGFTGGSSGGSTACSFTGTYPGSTSGRANGWLNMVIDGATWWIPMWQH